MRRVGVLHAMSVSQCVHYIFGPLKGVSDTYRDGHAVDLDNLRCDSLQQLPLHTDAGYTIETLTCVAGAIQGVPVPAYGFVTINEF